MSHNITTDSGNLFASPLNDWRSERAPANINLCEIPSWYPPCTHTSVSQLYNVGCSWTEKCGLIESTVWFRNSCYLIVEIYQIVRSEQMAAADRVAEKYKLGRWFSACVCPTEEEEEYERKGRVWNAGEGLPAFRFKCWNGPTIQFKSWTIWFR